MIAVRGRSDHCLCFRIEIRLDTSLRQAPTDPNLQACYNLGVSRAHRGPLQRRPGLSEKSVDARTVGSAFAMKRLILCLDGTWNSADQTKEEEKTGIERLQPSNVVKLAFRIAKRDQEIPQIVYYDEGVGTGNSLDRLTGGAFGFGLDKNIFEAYRFLVANFELGDEIFIFGYSRGAYTARSLAGMINKCGILKPAHIDRYIETLTLYRSPIQASHDFAKRHRERYAVDDSIPIEVVGVWDTVGALGIPLRGLRFLTQRKYRFHDVELGRSIKNGFHALAIDERRAPFEPTLWMPPSPEARGQNVKQVWFPGGHGDVGGGTSVTGLSDTSLQWMMDEVGRRLAFDPEVLNTFPLSTSTADRVTTRIRSTLKGLYRLTRGRRREIGTEVIDRHDSTKRGAIDFTQSLHSSVRERWDARGDYRPKNLKKYFKRIGDPRGR